MGGPTPQRRRAHSQSRGPQGSTQRGGRQETAMDTMEGQSLSEKYGDPVPFDDPGPDVPKSEGWKADYFKFLRYFTHGHYPSIPEDDLNVICAPVLRHLEAEREHWSMLREERPLELMPYLADVFERATALSLPTLQAFVKWIKVGSFYHAVIVQREQLNHVPHLRNVERPAMNQRSPNEDTLISHRQDYQGALSLTTTPLATLVKAQANLIVSLWICRRSQKEIKPLVLPPPNQAWLPQQAAGDASTSATQAAAQVSPPKGHKRQATGEPEHLGRPTKPFPLRLDNERRAAVKVLLDKAASLNHATSAEVVCCFKNKYPRLSPAEARWAANQLLVSLHEYHLMCVLYDPATVSPVLPKDLEDELRPVEEYYEEPPPGSLIDFHTVEAGYTLRYGSLIHRIDQSSTRGPGASQSVHHDDHEVGPLLKMLLVPGTCPLTAEAVISRVIAENVDTLERLRQETLLKATQAQKGP